MFPKPAENSSLLLIADVYVTVPCQFSGRFWTNDASPARVADTCQWQVHRGWKS